MIAIIPSPLCLREARPMPSAGTSDPDHLFGVDAPARVVGLVSK